MTAASQSVIARLRAAYDCGNRVALFFDYDGTLAPIVSHPDQAEMPLQTRLVLAELARQPHVFVGVLSGRSLDDLKRRVGLPGLYYCGTGGLELDLGGVRLTPPHPEHSRQMIATLTPTLADLAASFPGAWLEPKPFGVTLHYREVALDRQEELRVRAGQALQQQARFLRVLGGPKAVEVTADVGWTKGSAIRTFLRDIGPGTMPLVAGDAANDVDAFAVAQELGGITLGIGQEVSPMVQHRLPDPDALSRMLAEILASLRAFHSCARGSGRITKDSA